MTSSNANIPRPIDARQIDALNRYIDGLAQGIDPHAPDLDPGLVAAVRAIHGGDTIAAGPDPDRAGEDRLWRDLMQLRPRPELRALPRSPSATRLPPLTGDTPRSPVMARRGPPRAIGRLRHIDGRTLGMVATLTLVALVMLSALAVYLSAPDGTAPPTSIAGIGATMPDSQLPAAVAATPGVVGDAGPVPADAIRPIVQDCTVTSRTIDNVITTLARPYAEQTDTESPPRADVDAYAHRPYLVPNTLAADGEPRGPLVDPLPAGSTVDPDTIDELARLYGQWVGCGPSGRNDQLAQSALYSDDGLIRYFWRDGLGPSGFELVGLGKPPGDPYTGNLALAAGASPSPGPQLGMAPEYIPVLGEPWNRWLWGFRALDDGRVAAYVANSDGASWGSYPVTFAEMSGGQLINGYLVFVWQDDKWLIDELRGPFQG